MTDKKIIIDGVNVAECEYHSSTPNNELCYMKGNKCGDNPNCYYKQLQRKEQECEKWEWIRLYRSIVYEVSKIINEVKDAD